MSLTVSARIYKQSSWNLNSSTSKLDRLQHTHPATQPYSSVNWTDYSTPTPPPSRILLSTGPTTAHPPRHPAVLFCQMDRLQHTHPATQPYSSVNWTDCSTPTPPPSRILLSTGPTTAHPPRHPAVLFCQLDRLQHTHPATQPYSSVNCVSLSFRSCKGNFGALSKILLFHSFTFFEKCVNLRGPIHHKLNCVV